MNIVFLDRNVISTIKQKLNGKKILPFRNRALRKLNRSDNLISPLFSIREGQEGIIANENQTKITANEEANLINRYFKKAKTDSDFILENSSELANIFGNNRELKWNNYVSFLSEMNNLLNQQVSKKKQNEYKNIILEKALFYNIDIGHPIVMGCISVLYGSNILRGIFKFKKNINEEDLNKNIFNALNDLQAISRMSNIIGINKESNIYDKVTFITFDNNLKLFLEIINYKHINNTEDSTETSITYNYKLFPDLNENEFDILSQELLEKHNKSLEEEQV